MKTIGRAVVAIAIGGVLGLFVLPFLVIAVVAGQLQATPQVAPAEWDVPPELVPLLQNAGQQAAIPWFLLAAVASVATDFARHPPDGLARGQVPGTAISPIVNPAITTPGGGAGMFLIDRRPGTGALADPQDVQAAGLWLAVRMAALAGANPAGGSFLADAATRGFWQSVVSAAPLLIATVAPGGGVDLTPGDPGANPIRQFGSAVLGRIGAPSTGANLDAFAAWAAGEGSCARFNPLATTQPEPGATPFNNLSGGGHVWHYPSFAVGVQATTTALTNGLYRPVIDAFRASAGVAAVAAAVVRSPWGTKHFGNPTYAGSSCRANPLPATPEPPPLPTVSGPDAVAATIVARAARYQELWSQMMARVPATSP